MHNLVILIKSPCISVHKSIFKNKIIGEALSISIMISIWGIESPVIHQVR